MLCWQEEYPHDRVTEVLVLVVVAVPFFRCGGVLEAVRVSRSGYPTRMTHSQVGNSTTTPAWLEGFTTGRPDSSRLKSTESSLSPGPPHQALWHDAAVGLAAVPAVPHAEPGGLRRRPQARQDPGARTRKVGTDE